MYAAHINEFETSFLEDCNKIFANIDGPLREQQVDRVIVIEKDTDVFVGNIVPQTIENQSGVVSRKLKKQYETFDIEKQKGRNK